MCNKCPNSAFQTELETLINQAKQHPIGSPSRNRHLTQIIRMVSPLLCRKYTQADADAVQQTLFYLVKNFDHYDANRGCLVTWINAYLYFRRCTVYQQKAIRACHEISLDSTLTDDEKLCAKAITEIPSRDYGSLQMLDRIVNWIKTDPNGTLQETRLNQHPEVNAQTMILLRLPISQKPWKAIATQFGVPIPTLSAFYQRKCLPLLREFGRTEGFIS